MEEANENSNLDLEIQLNQLIGNLPDIIRIKSEGNLYFNNQDYDNALQAYKRAAEMIKSCEDKITMTFSSLEIKNKNLQEFKQNLRKISLAIYSNLALCNMKLDKAQESVENDIKVISIDPSFDKSYIRLIQNYIKLNKIDNAAYHLMKFKNNFTKETINKYSFILPELEIEIEKYNKTIKKSNSNLIRKNTILIFIAVIVLGLAFYYFKINKKPEEELEF